MARRNRKSRQASSTARATQKVKPTAEEMKQEKSFFIWTAAITLLIVLGLYFIL